MDPYEDQVGMQFDAGFSMLNWCHVSKKHHDLMLLSQMFTPRLLLCFWHKNSPRTRSLHMKVWLKQLLVFWEELLLLLWSTFSCTLDFLLTVMATQIFSSTRTLGKMDPIEHIFWMGWFNHQRDEIFSKIFRSCRICSCQGSICSSAPASWMRKRWLNMWGVLMRCP